MRTGLRSETVVNQVLGPGVIYRDFQSPDSPGIPLGATVNGARFVVTEEWYSPQIDGVLGDVKGLRRRVAETAEIQAALLEMSLENLLLALPGAVVSTFGTTHDVVEPGDISEGNYTTVAIVADTGKGAPFCGVLRNALCIVPNKEVNLGTGRESVTLPVTFRAHYDPADPSGRPWAIYVPK